MGVLVPDPPDTAQDSRSTNSPGDEYTPKYLDQVRREEPNGEFSLLGILGTMKTRSIDNYHLKWPVKPFPSNQAVVEGIYTNTAMTAAFTGSQGALDDVYHLKIEYGTLSATRKRAGFFRPGQQVRLFKDGEPRSETNAHIIARNDDTAVIRLTIQVTNVGDYTASTFGLYDVDTISLISSSEPEGSTMPANIFQKPEYRENKTTILIDPVRMTRTSMQTNLRTGKPYEEDKKDAKRLHMRGIQMAALRGVLGETTGHNGLPKRTNDGFVQMTRDHGLVKHYEFDTDYTGLTWIADGGGRTFILNQMETIFAFGGPERWALVGPGALSGIENMVWNNASSRYSIKSTKEFGISITKLRTVHGTINLLMFPEFRFNLTDSHSMWVFERRDLHYLPLQDTVYIKDPHEIEKKAGGAWVDGIEEAYLTEFTTMSDYPNHFALLTGVGRDNAL